MYYYNYSGTMNKVTYIELNNIHYYIRHHSPVSVHCTPGKQGLSAHVIRGIHEIPSPVIPGGQSPHLYPVGVGVQTTPVKQGSAAHVTQAGGSTLAGVVVLALNLPRNSDFSPSNSASPE